MFIITLQKIYIVKLLADAENLPVYFLSPSGCCTFDVDGLVLELEFSLSMSSSKDRPRLFILQSELRERKADPKITDPSINPTAQCRITRLWACML